MVGEIGLIHPVKRDQVLGDVVKNSDHASLFIAG
jgi:hypothetical protein